MKLQNLKCRRDKLLTLMLIIMLYIRVNSICSSGKVYPLLFGTGTWDLFINDMASFSTGDILIGGKSFSTKSVGEGFVAKLDQYGVFSWQKLYISTAPNEDSIDAVDIYNAYSFATGHSLSGSVNQYFVLKIASDGSIQYNYRVGTDTSNVGTDSIILGMSAVGESQVQVVFDGSVSGSHYIILSTLVMDGSTQESLIGFKGYPSSSGIKSSILSSTAQTIFCVLNNKLLALYYDSTNVYGTQGSYLTNELNTILTSPKTSSMSLKSDQSEGWIVSLSSDSYIYGILTNIAPASALNLARCFKINGFSSAPTKVSVNYIDSTHCIIVSYASGNNGYIMMIDQSTTSTPIIKMRIISGLNNGLIFSRYISSSSSFLIASNLIGGEASGLTKNQGIIYKSGNNFGFTTYNCYDISSTSSLIVQYTPTVYQLSFFDLLTLSGGLVYSTVNQVIGTSSFVKSTTLIPLRPQTMKNNVDGSSCTYFPVDAIYSSGSYQVYSSAPDVSFGSASQCQGISFITSVAIVGKVGTPSWIVYTSSSPALTLKPSVITSKDDLGTFTIVVSFYSSEVSHFISSTTFTATFVNSPPAITNSISNQVLYKGMGLKMISIPSNLFSDSETMTFAVTNNLSGIIPTTFSLSGNILSIKMPNNYTGSYTVTLTATDTFGQTSSFSFLFTISSCVQLGCDECKGSGAADCTLCKSGYVFSSGSCTQTSSTNSSSSSSTNVFDYLNRDVKASSPEGIGAPIVASVTSTIAVNIVSGASSSISGFGIAQCQNIQTLSLINMNIPNNYISFGLGLEVTKLNFKFVNFIGLQNSLNSGTRRNLESNGYKSLTNMGFRSSHLLVNYCYFLLLLIIMMFVHLIVSLLLLLKCTKNRSNCCSKFLYFCKNGLEFGWYLYLLVYASLIIFILVLNDFGTSNLSTVVNAISFILSIIMFCLLVLIMLVPIIFICRKRNRLYDSRNTSSDRNRTCIDKIELNIKEGLKISKLSSLYYTFFLFRNLIFAILVVCTDQKFQQLFIFIILNIVFLLYVAAIRPFQSKFHNLISIVNESCFLLCSLLMILFLNNGNQLTIIGIVIIALFSINIIFCFGAGVIYSFIYLFKQKCRRNVRNIVVGKEVKRYFTQKPEQDKEQEYEQEEQTINKEVQNNKPDSVFPSIFQKHEEQKYNFDEDQSGEKRPSIKDSNFALPVIGVK